VPGIPTRHDIYADSGKLGGMSSPHTSIVLVARVWRDDDGVRAILQASTTPGETAYRSLIEIRRALVDTLDEWYAATDSAEKPPPTG